MRCPYCLFEESRVLDSRETTQSETIRRRRECMKCDKRFTTYERIETALRIIKKDGTIEQYDRDKLQRGILRSCEKRPVTIEHIEKGLNRIEAKLRNKNTTDIPSKIVGELAMRELKKLDKIAYIRFASVYKDFEDIASFETEIIKLKT